MNWLLVSAALTQPCDLPPVEDLLGFPPDDVVEKQLEVLDSEYTKVPYSSVAVDGRLGVWQISESLLPPSEVHAWNVRLYNLSRVRMVWAQLKVCYSCFVDLHTRQALAKLREMLGSEAYAWRRMPQPW